MKQAPVMKSQSAAAPFELDTEARDQLDRRLAEIHNAEFRREMDGRWPQCPGGSAHWLRWHHAARAVDEVLCGAARWLLDEARHETSAQRRKSWAGWAVGFYLRLLPAIDYGRDAFPGRGDFWDGLIQRLNACVLAWQRSAQNWIAAGGMIPPDAIGLLEVACALAVDVMLIRPVYEADTGVSQLNALLAELQRKEDRGLR